MCVHVHVCVCMNVVCMRVSIYLSFNHSQAVIAMAMLQSKQLLLLSGITKIK